MHKIKEVIRVLFPLAAKRYPLYFPLMVFQTVCDMVQPFLGIWLTPMIVDGIVNGASFKTLITYAAVLVGGGSFIEGIKQIAIMKVYNYEERLNNYVRELIGEHAMELDFQLTEDKKALDQLEKANTGMGWYSGGVYGISNQIFKLIGNCFKITGFTAVIAMQMPWLLVIICVYVALNGLLTVKSNKIEVKLYGRLSKINRLFSYYGWEIVNFRFGKDVRLYEGSDMLVNKWDSSQDESYRAWKWQATSTLGFNALSTVLGIMRSMVTYGYAGLLAIRGVFTPGIFTQMVESAGGLDATLGGLVYNIADLSKRCNYAYEYVLFKQYPEALTKGDRPIADGPHRIEFRNVVFSYPNTDRKVLNGVSLTIEPGEKLSMVGLNGAGKTTMVKLLCRLYDPTEGTILVDGIDIREYDYASYMKQFAPVFQDFRLFSLPLIENICLKESGAITEADRTRAADVLKKTGLEDKLASWSKGFDTCLFKNFEEDGVEPSGGEQQKIAISRALYKDAPVVILDEPTAALDPIAEYEIYRRFDELVENRTAVYISHRLSSCRFCDHIAVFSEGRVAEYGTHDELVRRSNGIYAGMFEAQAGYYR